MDRINTRSFRYSEICHRITVVNKDRREPACRIVAEVVTIRHVLCGDRCDDVEVVVAGDGEVPHPARAVRGRVAAQDGGGAACRGTEVGALLEGACLDPAASSPAGAWYPEGVVAGGVDDRGPGVGADGQVVQ